MFVTNGNYVLYMPNYLMTLIMLKQSSEVNLDFLRFPRTTNGEFSRSLALPYDANFTSN